MSNQAWSLLQRVHEIQEKADNDDRELTDQERSKAETLLARAKQAKHLQDQLAEIDGSHVERGINGPTHGTGPGDQFVASQGYKAIQDPATRGQTWTTGPIELDTKATLTTTPGTALTPAEYRPGVVETLFQRLSIADLIPSETVSSNPIRYVVESTATNAAAGVAETAAKPESSIAFTEVSEPVRKLATFLPVSDEMLEDAPQVQSYLNGRLSLFVKQQEEAQLLLGNGVSPTLQGFVASGRAIGTYARGTVDANEVALFKAMNGVRGSSFLDPSAIVIHPTNWQAIRLGKDNSGQYYGGGPFLGAYGAGGPAGASQFLVDNLWGVPVIVTSAITVGTALVGAFRDGARIYRRSGVTVEASNSHSTFFQSNLVALRAEERLALGVFRPSAFCAVTGMA